MSLSKYVKMNKEFEFMRRLPCMVSSNEDTNSLKSNPSVPTKLAEAVASKDAKRWECIVCAALGAKCGEHVVVSWVSSCVCEVVIREVTGFYETKNIDCLLCFGLCCCPPKTVTDRQPLFHHPRFCTRCKTQLGDHCTTTCGNLFATSFLVLC